MFELELHRLNELMYRLNIILDQYCSNKIKDDEYTYYLQMGIDRLYILINETFKLIYSEDQFNMLQELQNDYPINDVYTALVHNKWNIDKARYYLL